MAKILKGNFARKKRAEGTSVSADKPVPGYQLKMAVAFSDPLIWRRVRVPGSMTLGVLHHTIQACMGWHDVDTHQFLVGKIFYQAGFGIEDMKKTPEYDEADYELHQLEEGMQFLFTYLYDGGEGWELELTLEDVITAGIAEKHPVLLAGERACPPEDIGDIHKYQALLAAFEQAGNESQITFDIAECPGFDPTKCDLNKIHARLSTIV